MSLDDKKRQSAEQFNEALAAMGGQATPAYTELVGNALLRMMELERELAVAQDRITDLTNENADLWNDKRVASLTPSHVAPVNRSRTPGMPTMRPDEVIEWSIGVLRGIVERWPEVLRDCDVESFINDQLQPTLDDMRSVTPSSSG